MRFSSLIFRVTLLFVVFASFLAVCQCARSNASLRGAVLVSGGSILFISLEPGKLKNHIAPIQTLTTLSREYAGSVATLTSPAI
jgi:hypothetical protein